MYDKYSSATPFTVGSKIPKHKGIIFLGATGASKAATVHFINKSGTTFSATLDVNSTPFILPVEISTVQTLPTGCTAYYLN